jgi:pentatricopeptide repeat protein
MAALLQAAARMRPAGARLRLAALQSAALRCDARRPEPAMSPWTQSQSRGISQSRALLKRKGGASAFVSKPSGPFRQKALKTKVKLKKGVAPHRTHLESMRELKSLEKANLRNERAWDQLEQDAELSRELDAAFDYLNNLGAQGDYVYEPEPTLADLDARDALTKLNALARGDPDVLDEVDGDHKELAVEDYNFLLRVYAVKGLHKEANALLSRMEKNLPPPLAALGGDRPVVAASNSNGSVDLALLDELDGVPHRVSPDAHSYMYYVCALVASRQAAAAVRTLGRMKERGVLPDVPTYNSVMNACAKAGKVQWAYNVMERMQVAGLVPDKASFTILMNSAIAENDLDKAFETFHLMRSHIAEPDVVAFSCLIHGYAKVGRVERALNLFEDLLESGLTPTQVTFNSLMNACAKSHYYAHKAVEFYHEMQELYDYVPDLYTYNTVLHACAKHGDFIQAEQIVRHMERHQVPKDEFTYNTLFNVYARAQVKSIVDKAPRNSKPAPVPEPIYQRPLEFDDDGNEVDLNRPGREVSSLANLDYDQPEDENEDDEDDNQEEDSDDQEHGAELSAEEAAQVEALRAADQQLVPSQQHDEALFADPEETGEFELAAMDLRDFGHFQRRNIARAEKWFREMTEERALPPSVVSLNAMLNVYANALHLRTAEQFLAEQFPKFGLQPDKFTFRALMHMYARAKRTAAAEDLMEQVKRRVAEGDLEADGVTFGLLVDHYARKRMLRRALTLLEDADAAGVQLEEKHLKKVRALAEKFGVFTDLIPEDPNAVLLAGSRHKLMAKRKVRAEVLAFNRKLGRRFLLPDTV